MCESVVLNMSFGGWGVQGQRMDWEAEFVCLCICVHVSLTTGNEKLKETTPKKVGARARVRKEM